MNLYQNPFEKPVKPDTQQLPEHLQKDAESWVGDPCYDLYDVESDSDRVILKDFTNQMNEYWDHPYFDFEHKKRKAIEYGGESTISVRDYLAAHAPAPPVEDMYALAEKILGNNAPPAPSYMTMEQDAYVIAHYKYMVADAMLAAKSGLELGKQPTK